MLSGAGLGPNGGPLIRDAAEVAGTTPKDFQIDILRREGMLSDSPRTGADDLDAKVYTEPAPAPAQPVGPQAWQTLGELVAQDYPPPVWHIHQAIPAGLSMLSGPAKAGKSFMALDMAIAIATGTPWLGRETKQGRVLYHALEDNPGRLKSRALIMLGGDPCPPGLCVSHSRTEEWNTRYGVDLGKGRSMERFIDDCAGFDLVILDTFSRAFPAIDQDNQRDVQSVLAPIQKAGVSVLMLDHTKKGGGSVKMDDLKDISWIEQPAGSRAKGATADGMLGLVKVSGVDEEDSETDVYAIGASLRDANGWLVTVSRDPISMRFRLSRLRPKRKKLLACLEWMERHHGESMEPKNIAEGIEVSVTNVYRLLGELHADGWVRKNQKWWCLAQAPA